MGKANSLRGYLDADFVIKPSMAKYKSTKIDEVEEMYAEGYKAGLDCIQQILSIISKKPNRINFYQSKNIF